MDPNHPVDLTTDEEKFAFARALESHPVRFCLVPAHWVSCDARWYDGKSQVTRLEAVQQVVATIEDHFEFTPKRLLAERIELIARRLKSSDPILRWWHGHFVQAPQCILSGEQVMTRWRRWRGRPDGYSGQLLADALRMRGIPASDEGDVPGWTLEKVANAEGLTEETRRVKVANAKGHSDETRRKISAALQRYRATGTKLTDEERAARFEQQKQRRRQL